MIDSLWLVFDVLLVIMLLVLAWAACEAREIRRAITLFIAFGLLLAIAWARLSAPDLALAEAIIGAGISGALLLSAMGEEPSPGASEASAVRVWPVNLLVLAMAVLMSWALVSGLPLVDTARLALPVLQNIELTGVSNPVTAVLLNFRAYDTLLELAVVLTAVLTILSFSPMRTEPVSAPPLLSAMVGWLVPVLVVSSAYLLWVGAHAPGGAFQAGALLASAMILLFLVNAAVHRRLTPAMIRWLLVAGVLAFVGAGVGMMLVNGRFLMMDPAYAGAMILLIETAATLSIAAALTLAYGGGYPVGWYADGAMVSGPKKGKAQP